MSLVIVAIILLCLVFDIKEMYKNEMYKTKINQNPDFLNDIFKFHQSSYDLRNEAYSSKKPNTVIYGTETVSYRCSQIWNNIPTEVRNANNLGIFKRQIKQITIPCSCKLCTQYIPNLGYIISINMYLSS